MIPVTEKRYLTTSNDPLLSISFRFESKLKSSILDDCLVTNTLLSVPKIIQFSETKKELWFNQGN